MKSITSILAMLALSVAFATAADEKDAAAAGEKPKRDPAEVFKRLDSNGEVIAGNEKELTNYNIFPGGMMTMIIVEPPEVTDIQ